MKTLSNGLVVLTLVLSLAHSVQVFANPISFAPTGDNSAGKIKCEVPVTAIGKTLLKSGTAIISDRVVTIKAASEFNETPRTILVGSVIRTEANITSEPPSVTGLALFLMGDMIGQIDDGTSGDTVFLKQNEKHVEGRIIGVQDESISFQTISGQQMIPLNSILHIRSPRVFVFKISLKAKQGLQKDTAFQAESSDVSFRPTSQGRTLSGSIIPPSERKQDDEFSMSGIGGMTSKQSGVGAMNSIAPPGARSAVGDPRNDFFDTEEKERFGSVKTKWGRQQITVPPGMFE